MFFDTHEFDSLYDTEPVYRGCGVTQNTQNTEFGFNSSIDLSLGELEPVPEFCKLSSMLADGSHSEVFLKLKTFLDQKQHVVYEAFPETNEIQGIYHDIAFEITLYQASQNILLEFTRHSGCAFEFNVLETEIRAELVSPQERGRGKGIRGPPPLNLNMVDIKEEEQEDKQEDISTEDYVETLLLMCESLDVMQNCDGLAGLTALFSSSQQQAEELNKILESNLEALINVIMNGLNSGHVCLRRSATTCFDGLAPYVRMGSGEHLASLIHTYLENQIAQQMEYNSSHVFSELFRQQTEQKLRDSMMKLQGINHYATTSIFA